MIPYARHEVTEADIAAVTAVLRSDRLAQGPRVVDLEAALCEATGARYAVCVANGTAALWCVYAEILEHDGWNIVTTPCTFVATLNAMWYGDRSMLCLRDLPGLVADGSICGGVQHFNSLPVAVSIGGAVPRVDRHGVIDGAHALGAIQAHHVAGCRAITLSFHPAKQVAAGEGGAVLTNDDELAHACRMLRDNGRYATGQQYIAGLNLRMDEMSAALALSQLGRLRDNLARRRARAHAYDKALDGCPVAVPVARPADSALHLYQVLCPDGGTRDGLMAHLRAQGIGTQVHYRPVYWHPYWQHLDDGTCPNATAWGERSLSLPFWPGMTDGECHRVVDGIERYVEDR